MVGGWEEEEREGGAGGLMLMLYCWLVVLVVRIVGIVRQAEFSFWASNYRLRLYKEGTVYFL